MTRLGWWYTLSVVIAIVASCVMVPIAMSQSVDGGMVLWAGACEWWVVVGLLVGLPYTWVRLQWWATEELSRLRDSAPHE